MTQIGELALVNTVDETNDDKCPFCYKARHKFPSAKKKASSKVTSKPGQLKCPTLVPAGPWPHTTAKHHLISAIQCYAKVRRLVRMATMVGYDINDPPNGIALPTVANNIRYSLRGGAKMKFGAFGPAEKKEIAFEVMAQAKAQWHVGHHGFEIDIPQDWGDELDDDYVGHTISYDTTVIEELLAILDAWVAAKWCEEEEDKSDKIKKEMDQLSDRIRAKLDMFATEMPASSLPFFVSRQAFDYANEGMKRRRDDDDEDPPPKKARK